MTVPLIDGDDLTGWDRRLSTWLSAHAPHDDPAHDLDHLARVRTVALQLAAEEGGDRLVVLAAALLHDLIALPKNHPDRAQASTRSAAAATALLDEMGFPRERVEAVAHAIAAHSWSAEIPPLTVEARIVQDADRLDALGAIGIARCFATSGRLGRPLADAVDPLAQRRTLNDHAFALDHFATKLLRIEATLTTAAGRRRAAARTQFLLDFRQRFCAELTGSA